MEEKLESEGKCLFCNKLFPQKQIGKHLATHLAIIEKEDSTKTSETYCHIMVEWDVMFLYLLVKGRVTMEKIDTFLQDIWLDCCGHMSNFGQKNLRIPMSQKVMDIFETKVKIHHIYDYGDTTRVFLKGIKNYQLNFKENIILLSRNEPLKWICAKCGKQPAVNICIECNWDFYCESCSTQHENECEAFIDYAQMPVVNSPRMGVCGYTGGHIDKERDGVYKNNV